MAQKMCWNQAWGSEVRMTKTGWESDGLNWYWFKASCPLASYRDFCSYIWSGPGKSDGAPTWMHFDAGNLKTADSLSVWA